jgi:hypothetical protein
LVWIRSHSKRSTVVRADIGQLRALLLDIVRCGLLMPSVQVLEPVGDGVYHYRLDAFATGAVRLQPDYEARFDVSDPAAIRWAPHGEHNFRSWGVFRTEPGPADGEVLLEIDTRAEADVDISPVMVTLVEPFARQSSDEVTRGFLANITSTVESAAGRQARS